MLSPAPYHPLAEIKASEFDTCIAAPCLIFPKRTKITEAPTFFDKFDLMNEVKTVDSQNRKEKLEPFKVAQTLAGQVDISVTAETDKFPLRHERTDAIGFAIDKQIGGAIKYPHWQ